MNPISWLPAQDTCGIFPSRTSQRALYQRTASMSLPLLLMSPLVTTTSGLSGASTSSARSRFRMPASSGNGYPCTSLITAIFKSGFSPASATAGAAIAAATEPSVRETNSRLLIVIRTLYHKTKKLGLAPSFISMVASQGLEPQQQESESWVLPLHHEASESPFQIGGVDGARTRNPRIDSPVR